MTEAELKQRTPGCLALSTKIDQESRGQVNFFHARYEGTIHRIYAVDTELLFIDTGLPTLDAEQRAQQVAGRLGYGFIPGIMGQVAAAENQCHVDRWMKALDGATPEQIREFVDADPQCFRIAGREAYDVRVDPPGIWDLLRRGRACKAVARLGHADRGNLVLELPTIEDVGVVIGEFPRLFGAACQINIHWDSI